MHVQNNASTAYGFKPINLFLNFMAKNSLKAKWEMEIPLISKMLVMVAKALSAVSQSHFSGGGGGGSPRRRQWRPLHRKLECFLVSLRCQH